MLESVDGSLVRIRTADGGVVGAGFLVGKCHVLTCAHVIADALGLTDIPADPPLSIAALDFPLLAPHTRLAARVAFWCPEKEDGSGDIAGLELLGDPPDGARIVHFTPAEDVWEHPFHAFGFPTGHDDGTWATGRLLGRQANNWLLLEDVKTEGFAVMPGFSGGPVWDTKLEGVVGMVVAASRRTETKTAFVIPFDVLATTWHLLQPIEHQRVFLSAAPADMAFAERLSADLQAQGIVVWDELHGPDGSNTNAQERVRQSIRAAQAVVLVVSSQARTSRTVKEHLHMADLYQRRLIQVWKGDNGHTQPPTESLRDTVWVDAQNTPYETALKHIETALSQRLSYTDMLESLDEVPRNPYKGLRPFTSDDVGDFFGRERLVNDLINDVATILKVESPRTESERCLTIIGPSGSGKSSVVMAGLLPRLQHAALPESDTWIYLEPMLPGQHPIEALMDILKPHFPESSFKTLREDLEDDATRGLHLLAKQLVKERAGRVVLLVDQFEELFTQTESEDERQRFIDLLLTAATTPDGPLLVLLTLRADFYDRPMQYPSLSRLIQAHQRPVLPMDAEDLRATIERPAALPDVQLTFEGNLIGDLLFEMQGQIGALPLLQFTLDQLFERRDGHRLTLQAYHEMGGVKGALSQHAEQTYAALSSDEHRRLAQALFLRLMELGASEQDITRRRVELSELASSDPTQTRQMHETIDAFIAARLLTASKTTETTTLEVSHEAVLREWNRIADWLHESHGDILIQQDLSKDAVEWEQHGKPRDRLYRGSQLKDVQVWAKRNRPSEREQKFLRASATQRTMRITSIIAAVFLLVSLIAGSAVVFYRYGHPDPTLVTTLEDNGNGSLRYCIENASSGSTIRFRQGLQGTINLRESLSFPGGKQLTIQGLGAKTIAISGGKISNTNIQVPSDARVTLSDLSFKDAKTTIFAFIMNYGTLTLSNDAISNNKTSASATSYGGGIYNRGTLNVQASTISNNSSTGGRDGDQGDGQGGGIVNEGKLTVTTTIFSNNIARSNSSSGNIGAGIGGSIGNSNGGTVTVINSTFSENVASSSSGSGFGGGVENSGNLSVTNSNFYKNSASGISDSSFGEGGGIHNYNTGTTTVINSTFSGNMASNSSGESDGGGIYNEGKLAVTNSTFSDNIARNSSNSNFSLGGGIYNYNTGTVTVTTSTLSGNTASNSNGDSQGGGIDNEGKLSVTNSTISGNKAVSTNGASYGGGICSYQTGTVMVTSSTFSDNSVSGDKGGQGGGIDNEGNLTVTASTFSNNEASGGNDFGGGGISFSGVKDSSTTIQFCTIYGNTSSAGGGVWIDPTSDSSSHLTISNSIIAANSAPNGPDISGSLNSGGYNLLTNVTGANGLSSTDQQVTLANLQLDPTLGNNGKRGSTQTLKLLPGSVAIDAIPLQACSISITGPVSGKAITITTDQRGDPRPDGAESTCDIGAYESSY